jgi:hypothetical protein
VTEFKCLRTIITDLKYSLPIGKNELFNGYSPRMVLDSVSVIK